MIAGYDLRKTGGYGDRLAAGSDSEFSARKHEKRTATASPENARANFGAARRLQSSSLRSSSSRVIQQASSWQGAFERN